MILLLVGLAGVLAGSAGVLVVVSGRRRRFRRVALHMKPGHGPTVEGLLVLRTAREFHVRDASIVGADGDTRLANPARVLRENVFGYEVLG